MSLKSSNFLLWSAVFAVCCISLAACEPGDQNRTVSPDFDGKEARLEISGAACVADRCIAVNDETEWAQEFTLEDRSISPGQRLYLLPKGSGEIDAEAAAASGDVIYITGSHGLSRRKAKFRASQFLLFRWTPGTGQVEQTDRLREAIQQAESIGAFAEQPLDRNGVNIEGMAERGDRLFFGFRGPNIEGTAFVLEVSAAALFSDAPVRTVTHRVPLGDGIGIRDMTRVQDGFLLLTGPVNDRPNTAAVVAWSPGAPPRILTTLDPAGDAKAETLLVLDESSTGIRALIFYDGLKNGAPREIEIRRPSP